MNGKIAGKVCALALAGVAWQSTGARAEIVGGGAPATPGADFVILDPPPATVGGNTFQSPSLVGFDELQDIVLTEDLMLGPNRTLPAGSTVSSHYIAFDPDGPGAIDGFVLFDEPIVAIIGTPPGLNGTAGLFGLPGTSYSAGGAIGPDNGQGPNAGDQVRVSQNNPRRLNFTAGANNPGDQVRVLTGTLVPEPAGVFLLAIAACYVAAARPSRRKF
ncbi:MAG: hypothetical protein AAF589_07640 [Planctomycetota bacterium]